MSSLFSKALVYLGLVDEDQVDEPRSDQYVATPEPTPAVTEPQGRRVEPPPTARTAIRPQARDADMPAVAVRPVEVQSDILVVEEFADARVLADRVRERVPVILFGKAFWKRVIDLDFLAEQGTISPGDQDIIDFVDSAAEAWQIISRFYEL